MNPRNLLPLLPALFALPFAAFTFACGGKAAGDDVLGGNRLAQTQGEKDKDKSPESSSTKKNDDGEGSSSGEVPHECSHSYQSGSGGGGGPGGEISCEATNHYECPEGERTLTIKCKGKVGQGWGQEPGTLECGGQTFEVDCEDACSFNADHYAKCNLPAPPPDQGGGQGSTSSSSGGAGSTSSSSGGFSSGSSSGG